MFATVEVTHTAARRTAFDAASSGGVGELTLRRRLPSIDLFVKRRARSWDIALLLLSDFCYLAIHVLGRRAEERSP